MRIPFFIVLVFLLSTKIFADYSIIPKGGLNVTSLSSSDVALEGTEHTSEGLNIYVGFEKIVNSNLALGVDVMVFSIQGINYKEIIETSLSTKTTSSRITSFNSGLAPIAKTFINFSEITRIYAFGGGTLSLSYHNKYIETITLHNKIYREDDEVETNDKMLNGEISNYNYGLIAGIGFGYAEVIAEVKFLYGLSDLELFENITSYHRVFSFSAGYSFNFID